MGLRLERLNVSANALKNLPPALGGMGSLLILKADGNPMRTIAQNVLSGPVSALLKLLRSRMGEAAGGSSGGGGAPSGGEDVEMTRRVRQAHTDRRLDLSGMALADVPPAVWALGERLAQLCLANNRLAAIPDAVASLVALESLDVSANPALAWLPPALSALAGLRELRLARCRGLADLSLLPHLRALTFLDISYVGPHVAGLLESAWPLPALVELRLQGCNLTALPRGLAAAAPRLAVLLASDNALVDVTRDELHRAPSLTSLDLTNNALAAVPLELGFIERLQHLGLHGNPFRSPPIRVLDKGTESVKAFLRDRRAG